MTALIPCLWFDGRAEEAARFYVSIIPDSRIDAVHRAPADYPAGAQGDVLTVAFTLAGRPFVALNAGPNVAFNEAVSFQLPQETQAEIDRLATALSAHPEREMCGWVKDRYGVFWQIYPRRLTELLADPDRAKAKRCFEAMMTMRRIDIAAIERAAAGEGI